MKVKDSRKYFSGLVLLLIQSVLLAALTLLCVIPFSCKVSEEGIIFVGGDYVSPVLEEITVLDERTVNLTFSEKVKPKSFVVSEQVTEISDSSEHSETTELSPALKAAAGGYGKVESNYSLSEDGCTITYSAVDRYEVGKAYEIFGVVEDKAGNTLTYCVPFCGYNSCLPKLIMTEVQPKYKKYKENVYRCEYVELLALTDGNLSGLELFSAADGESKKCSLPPVNVKAGELLLLHLRSAGEGCITETDDLNASSAAHSGKNIRDIWVSNDKARLSDNTDVIMIRNSVDGMILDALMYAAEDAVEWGKGQAAFAEEVSHTGIYTTSSVTEVEVNSGLGSSAVKAFCRTDAAELQSRALAGETFEADSDYPVRRNEDTWVIQNVNPGSL